MALEPVIKLKFPTRKALALLIYLAVEGGRHSREKLTALFWPESDTQRGRAALRNTLAYLRSALRQAADVEPGGASTQQLPLIVEQDALGFDFNSDFELDLHMLQAAVQAIQAPAVSDRRLLTQLRAAVDLYRGDFLEGFSLPDAPDFDTWVSIQREYWHHCMTQVCDQLSQLLAREGRVSQAMDAVTRWLTLDPLNEDAYRRLMALHFTAGDRDAALRAYEACRAMLSRELNAEPTPETQALAERIRSEAAPPSRPGIPSLPPTFLADAASLDLLHYLGGRWAGSESGAPVLLLLSLRTDALVTTPSLADWLTGLERDLPLTRLTLRPLTAEDTLQLVQSLAGVEHESRGAEEQGSDWHSGDFSPAPLHPRTSAFAQWLFAGDPRPAFLHHRNPQGTDRTRLAARTGYAGRGVDARLRGSDRR